MSHSYGFSVALSLWSVLAFATPAPSQVLTDGTTSTTVTVGANGAVTVGVAPVTGNGVSLNRFEEFNVPEQGLALDNRVEAARTIVNEVTGQHGSTLSGDVEVLGQRAHVIIANPNGIVVDGTRFFNTGRVALTTGEIGTTNRLIAPTVTQLNVTSTVDRGVIRVEGGGLSGQMDAVDLIAHEILINGEVRNDSESPTSGIRLIAGKSRVEFESSVLPGNTDLNWGSVSAVAGAASDSVLIEILRPGALRANRIGIQVTEAGAGVRMAGDVLATSREFALSATGKVTVLGAHIIGTGGVALSGSEINLSQTAIESPSGSVILRTTKQGLSLATSQVAGLEVLMTTEGQATFSYSSVKADAGNLTIASGQQLKFGNSDLTAENSILLSSDADTTLDSSTVTARGNVTIDVAALTVESTTKRARITAENGSLLVQTRVGDLVNNGGLLQGAVDIAGVQTSNGTAANGAITLNIAGSLRNRSGAELAVIFGLVESVSIRTGGDIENLAGRIVAGENVEIVAVGDVLNLTALSADTLAPHVVSNTRRGKRLWWTFWLRREQITETTFDYGQLRADAALPTISAGASVTVTADTIINRGGTFSAATGDLNLRAIHVETLGLGHGIVKVTQVCALTCRSTAEGSTGVQASGLFAGNDLTIQATTSAANVGSLIQAQNNVAITSPDVRVAALATPMAIQRPKGLYNLFVGQRVWFYMRDYFGAIIAASGALTINSSAPIRLLGGSFESEVIVIPSGQTTVRPPSDLANPGRKMIGWFQNLPLIRN